MYVPPCIHDMYCTVCGTITVTVTNETTVLLHVQLVQQ
jgi:hypothetical protein